MLPSLALTIGNARAASPRHTTDTLSAHDDEDFERDDHVLIGSPPSPFIADNLEHDGLDQRHRQSVDFGSISHRNMAAIEMNKQYAVQQAQAGQPPPGGAPKAHGLQIETDLAKDVFPLFSTSSEPDINLRHSVSASSIPKRTPSIRAALHSSAGSLSPGSALSSPQLAAMLNITPLPSPVEPGRDLWRVNIRTRSRGSSLANAEALLDPKASALSPPSSPPKRKAYSDLRTSVGDTQVAPTGATGDEYASYQTRHRSISEYVPEAITFEKLRFVAVSGTGPMRECSTAHSGMRREEYLAVQRGFSVPSPRFKIRTTSASTKDASVAAQTGGEPEIKETRAQIYTAQSVVKGHPRKYKMIRQLGQGTFSKVFLAVRQVENENDSIDYAGDSTNLDGVRIRSRRLVAVKVIEQGPAGGGDVERAEISLRRELEILKAINHPSLVHLKAFGTQNNRSLLVLNYCPGGDLFEVASSQLEVLVPSLVRRIFAELVSAVRYLHQKFIVHRDIKLENVLLNIPIQVHSDVPDWQTLDRAVVTLTDLGLSRRIPEPPESPLLTTRCGSEDYAAPELLMGQPYDGRQTDAWALGVMLYALMEGRLPFDPLPGARGDPAKLKARTPHRIARCEWAWYRHGDEDGDWAAEKGKDYEGARAIVEGLLKRNSRRKSLDEIREMPWVKKGIVIGGGLRRFDEEVL